MLVVEGRRSGWGTGLMDGPAGVMLKPSEVVTGMICAVVRCARAARRGRVVWRYIFVEIGGISDLFLMEKNSACSRYL